MTDSSIKWKLGEPTPKPTQDHEMAMRDLTEFGYCIIENALKKTELLRARERLTEQAEAELQAGIAFEDQGPNQDFLRLKNKQKQYSGINQRVWMLVNKGEIFRDLVTKKGIVPLIEFLLGKDFLLSTLSANIAKPGGTEMGLHTDQWWMPRPMAPIDKPISPGNIKRGEYCVVSDNSPTRKINPPCACNVMYCLNDFTETNGATRLVPKSHLTGMQPPPDVPHTVESIPAVAKAGSAIIFEGRLWHGTGANRSAENRLGLLATYCGPQFRPQENYTVGLDPEIRAIAKKELLDRLGFKIWHAYGRTGDPNTEYINVGKGKVGEMKPKK